jgi:hypothetical protein
MKWINDTDLLVNPGEDDPNKRIVFRQVGWLGQTGELYAMDEDPTPTEPGSFGPIYHQIAPE